MSLRFPDGSRTQGGPYGSPDNLTKIPSPPPRGRGGRDRGGWNEGAAWNRRPARRDMDIVDKELNRYQPAFDHVQRYPEGYGGQPGGFGGGRGRGRGGRGGRGGGWDDNKFDRFIGAIEGLTGKGGGNVTNTFNPTFNPTNVNAGRDIRDTSIIGGGPNTAGRDITGAGGDVDTGDGGGGNTVNTNPVITNPGGTNPGGTNPGGTNPGGTDPGGTDPVETTPVKYDEFINRTYNELLGRDAGQEGLDWWGGDLDRGASEQDVIDNIKRNPEYINREMAKSLASSMEGKTYEKDTAGSLGNINEKSLDAWIGPGGALTQSSDANAKGYYQGVGDKSAAANLLYKPDNSNLPDGQAGLTGWASDLSERDSKIYDLYQTVFGRNPDEEGLKYWTGAGGQGMSFADIEASFRGSAEAKLRDNVAGTSNFVSTDDYIAGKQNQEGGGYDASGNWINKDGTSGPAPVNDQGISPLLSTSPPVVSPHGDPEKNPVSSGVGISDKVDNFLGTNTVKSPHGDPAKNPILVAPGTGEVTPLPRVVDGAPGAEIPGLETDPIGTLYGDLLGRSPDAEGHKYWTDQLSSGNQTYDQIADNIMRSDEYKNRRADWDAGRQLPPDPPNPPSMGPGTRGGGNDTNRGPVPPTPSVPAVPLNLGIRSANPSPISRGPARSATPKPLVHILPTPKPAPPKPSDWLQQAYTSAGLGKVDPGGRDYWMGDLKGGASKADVIANIMRHKK